MIRKEGKKYVLRSHRTGKVLARGSKAKVTKELKRRQRFKK